MGQFFILRSGCNKSTTVCLLTHWTVLLKAVCPWIISNGLLTKLELSCVRNIIPHPRKRLWNGYPVLHQELQNHDPVGGTYPYRLCMGVPPPPGTGFLFSLTSKEEHTRTRSWFLITLISSWLQLVWRHWFLLASLLHLFHSWFPE